MSVRGVEIQENVVYTLEEVCKILKTSDTNLRRKLKEGAIRFTRLGRQYRFLGRDILAFLRGTREQRVEEFFQWLDEVNKQKNLPPVTAEEAAKALHTLRKKKGREVA